MQKRALIAVTLLSLGTPMLLAGDEIGHTQHGNNNAYCQDNDTTWLNWEQADTGLQSFVAGVLALRQQRRWLQSHSWWSAPEAPTTPVAQWFAPDGQPMHAELWHQPQVQALLLLLGAGPGNAAHLDATPADTTLADCLILLNPSADAQQFILPAGAWFCHLDSARGEVGNAPLTSLATVPAGSLCLASRAVLAVTAAAARADSPPQKNT
jgi:glycogen operon protein